MQVRAVVEVRRFAVNGGCFSVVPLPPLEVGKAGEEKIGVLVGTTLHADGVMLPPCPFDIIPAPTTHPPTCRI